MTSKLSLILSKAKITYSLYWTNLSRNSTAVELAKAQDPTGWILLNLSLKFGLLWHAIVPIIPTAKFQHPFDIWSLHKIARNLTNCFYSNYVSRQKVIVLSSKYCEQSQTSKSIHSLNSKSWYKLVYIFMFSLFPPISEGSEMFSKSIQINFKPRCLRNMKKHT